MIGTQRPIAPIGARSTVNGRIIDQQRGKESKERIENGLAVQTTIQAMAEKEPKRI
jgi:hypothetical protein